MLIRGSRIKTLFKWLFWLLLAVTVGMAGLLYYLSLQLSPLIEEEVRTILEENGATDVSMDSPSLKLYRLALPNLSFVYQDTPVQIGELSGHWSSESFSRFVLALRERAPIQESLPIERLVLRDLEIKDSVLNPEIQFEAKLNGLRLSYTVTASLPTLSTTLKGNGKLEIGMMAGELEVIGEEVPLKQLFLLLEREELLVDLPVSFSDGVVTPAARFIFDGELSQKYWLTVQRAKGHSFDADFDGGYGTIVLVEGKERMTLPPFELLVQDVKYGLSGKNFTSKIGGEISYEGEYTLAIGPSKIQTLDTVIEAEKFSLSQRGSTFTVPLSSESLAIEELIKLYPESPVKGQGKISFELPVEISKNGVQIKNGKIQGLSPGGRLYYEDKAAVQQLAGSQYGFALNALQDYRFTKLEAIVTLKPDGELLLKTSLAGKAPKLNKTKPVDVNLNIEQNLFKLLESIRAVQKYGAQ